MAWNRDPFLAFEEEMRRWVTPGTAWGVRLDGEDRIYRIRELAARFREEGKHTRGIFIHSWSGDTATGFHPAQIIIHYLEQVGDEPRFESCEQRGEIRLIGQA